MATLGSCLIASNIPYEGMAKDIIERRIQGQSWKQIGEDLNIGSPGAARKMFTKLTGIDDYKIKGPDLLKLIDKGVPDTGLPKAVTKVQKAPAKAVELPEMDPVAWHKVLHDDIGFLSDGYLQNVYGLSSFEAKIIKLTHPSKGQLNSFSAEDWLKIFEKTNTNKPKSLTNFIKETTKTPDVVQPTAKKIATKAEVPDVTQSAKKYDWIVKEADMPAVDDIPTAKRDSILDLHTKGNGYQAISQKTGVAIPDVDRVVARALLEDANGDPYKALLKKPDSLELQKTLSDKVYGAIQKGISPTDLKAATGIPKALIDDIVKANGKWTKPFGTKLPEDPLPVKPPSYQTSSKKPAQAPLGKKPSGSGTGFGEVDIDAYPKATNDQLLAMRKRQWSTVKSGEERRLPEFHTRSYTGSEYHSINTGLRRGTTDHTRGSKKTVIKNMDDAMYEIDAPFSVTRGMGLDGFGMGHLSETHMNELVGKTFVEKGYMSTSTKPVFGGGVRLNIEVPAGARGHWAKPISIHSSEDEFILARNTRFMVLGVEKAANGTYKVRVRVVV